MCIMQYKRSALVVGSLSYVSFTTEYVYKFLLIYSSLPIFSSKPAGRTIISRRKSFYTVSFAKQNFSFKNFKRFHYFVFELVLGRSNLWGTPLSLTWMELGLCNFIQK